MGSRQLSGMQDFTHCLNELACFFVKLAYDQGWMEKLFDGDARARAPTLDRVLEQHARGPGSAERSLSLIERSSLLALAEKKRPRSQGYLAGSGFGVGCYLDITPLAADMASKVLRSACSMPKTSFGRYDPVCTLPGADTNEERIVLPGGFQVKCKEGAALEWHIDGGPPKTLLQTALNCLRGGGGVAEWEQQKGIQGILHITGKSKTAWLQTDLAQYALTLLVAHEDVRLPNTHRSSAWCRAALWTEGTGRPVVADAIGRWGTRRALEALETQILDRGVPKEWRDRAVALIGEADVLTIEQALRARDEQPYLLRQCVDAGASWTTFPSGFWHCAPKTDGLRITSLTFTGFISRMSQLEPFLDAWVCRVFDRPFQGKCWPSLPLLYEDHVDRAARRAARQWDSPAAAFRRWEDINQSRAFSEALRRSVEKVQAGRPIPPPFEAKCRRLNNDKQVLALDHSPHSVSNQEEAVGASPASAEAWFVAMVVKEDPTPWNLNAEKVNEVMAQVVASLYSLDGFECRRGYDAIPCCGIVDVCYPYAFPQLYKAELEGRLREEGLKLVHHSDTDEGPGYDVCLIDVQSSWALHEASDEEE